MTNQTFATAQIKAQAPAQLPLTHALCQVDSASEDYDGNFSSRYVTEATRRRIEDAIFAIDDEEDAAKKEEQKVLASVACDAEDFWTELGGEPDEHFDGIERGSTEDAKGLARFAKHNQGRTLSELIDGVRYGVGFVWLDFDGLINSRRFEEEAKFDAGSDEQWDVAALEAADRYVLQADATFVLTA